MSILSLLFLSFVNIYLVLSVAGFLKTLPPIRQAVFFFRSKTISEETNIYTKSATVFPSSSLLLLLYFSPFLFPS